jgi:hypothetical protein
MRAVRVVATMAAVLLGTGEMAWGVVYGTLEPTPGFSSPTLSSYTIRMYGALAFENVSVKTTPNGSTLATVHQANMIFGEVMITTPYVYDFFGIAAPERYDTHFLFASGDILSPFGAVQETNSGLNEAGLRPSPPFTYGLGTFDSNLAFAFKTTAVVNGLDFMQVVAPKSTAVWVTGRAVDYATKEIVPFAIGPEPGSVAMLVAGAMCLVVVWWRKWRG